MHLHTCIVKGGERIILGGPLSSEKRNKVKKTFSLDANLWEKFVLKCGRVNYSRQAEDLFRAWVEGTSFTQLPLRALDAHSVEVLTAADAIIRGLIQGLGKGEPSSLRKTSR